MTLSKEQIARYGRQLILPEVGMGGQAKLSAASVLVIGAGGLGSPAALYLAAAGVGRLGIMDPDTVSLSNLHRQILYGTDELGLPKAVCAARRLRQLNPHTEVLALQERFDADNAQELAGRFSLVVDGSDNFPTRYLANDACVLSGKPLVHGGVVNFQGQVLTVLPRRSACLRCVFPEPPKPGAIPSCQEAGVLGAEAGIIGSLMAHEALKLILGVGSPLADRMLVFEGRASAFREVELKRDLDCAVCGQKPSITAVQSIEHAAACMEQRPTQRMEGLWHASR
jgi:adenylyltransferase/sulfurtransferase